MEEEATQDNKTLKTKQNVCNFPGITILVYF
jgi:hypothetical protein